MSEVQMGHGRGGTWLTDQYRQVKVWDGTLARVRETAARRIARQFVRETALIEMLGRWVSGLEPVLVLNQHGHLMGLSIADARRGDRARLMVRIRGGVAI